MRKAFVSVAVIAVTVGVLAPGSLAASLQAASVACQGGWTNARPPAIGVPARLNAVAAFSKTDVWAVGQTDSQVTTGTLAEHWDGRSWSIAPTPNPSLSPNGLYGVAGASSDDVWAVGTGGAQGVLALHWDGITWSEVPTPDPGPYGGFLYDVAVIEPKDVWAVGIAFGSSEEESFTLTEHWDGTAWSVVPSPSPESNSFLSAVSADAGSDVWAVGPALVEQWDGTSWNVMATPWPPLLSDVAAFGPGDVWVAGWTLANTQPAFQHFDGATWTDVIGPVVPGYGQIMGIGGPSSGRLWAVGTQERGALIERWDGTSWRVGRAPSPHSYPPAGLIDVAVGSDGVAWSVGTTTVDFGDPLVERTCRH